MTAVITIRDLAVVILILAFTLATFVYIVTDILKVGAKAVSADSPSQSCDERKRLGTDGSSLAETA